MNFFLKRILHKTRDLRTWAFLALLPAIIFMVYKALSPDLFEVSQDLSLTADAPVALTASPTDFQPVSWFLKHQDEFFLDTYTLRALNSQLNPESLLDQKNNQALPSIKVIRECMSLQSTANNNTRVTYAGKDKALGQQLVDFYAKRLVKKAEEGIKRSALQTQAAMPGDSAQKNQLLKEKASSVITTTGDSVVYEQNAFWRQNRLLPAVGWLIAGLILFVCAVLFVETLDTSFKSERQVAAFLQLPILGTLPNLNKISRYIGMKSSK